MLFLPHEEGQGLVVIVILALLGPAVGNVFSNIMSAI
jgi:hypothetical protein